MPKNLNIVWVHIVFSTRDRKPFLTWNIRNEVCEYIKTEGNRKGYFVDTVNGVNDHLHVLMRLKTTQPVCEAVNWIKGASSRWLNAKYRWGGGFAWQEGYGVFSVGKKEIRRIRNYIYYQEKHHASKTLDDELKALKS